MQDGSHHGVEADEAGVGTKPTSRLANKESRFRFEGSL